MTLDQLTATVDLVTLVALIGGLFFAGFQWRASRRESRRQAQVLLLRSFDSPEFVRAMWRLMDLPDGLNREQILSRLTEVGTDLLWYWLGAMESIGILVFNREIDIRLVDQTFSGPVIVTWHKLEHYVADVRRVYQRDSMHEWFQWLAEHLELLERDEGRSAAHVRERDWRP